MSPRKRATKLPLVSGPLASLVRFLIGPGRSLALALVVLAGFGGAWYWGWQEVRADVAASPAYTLSPANIVVTNRPEWMGFDIRTQVFHNAGLPADLSIMAPDLTERVATAFAMHPWVAEVRQVRKEHPARVVVDLRYHEPVLMVHSPPQIIPVDVDGNVLPQGDIPRNEAVRYPRLDRGDLPTARGLVGDPWGDQRVVGAARIAAALGDRWQSYGFRTIEPVLDPTSPRPQDTLYRLHTHGGSIVLWWRAPGMEHTGDPSVEEKLACLDAEHAKYGTLEGPNDTDRLIDLHLLIRTSQAAKAR